MHTSQRQQLQGKSYGQIIIVRMLIGLIRFLFDIPSFLKFLASGEVESKTHR